MAKATRTTLGFIYFVHAPDLKRIKIGFTVNLKVRLNELQMGSPADLKLLVAVRGPLQVEFALLAAFHNYRIHGEWFRAAPCLMRFIESLKPGVKLAPEDLLRPK